MDDNQGNLVFNPQDFDYPQQRRKQTSDPGVNPCLCWNLKDGCVTVGIWTLVFSLGDLALFGWQTFALNQCRSLTIAQANRQCLEYCPCAAGSTATIDTLLFSIVQMAIFGWQTAVIKWEKDRERNTLLPETGGYPYTNERNPAFYERYYQTPKEQWYTAIFVIQILMLICSFFLLFASVFLIYGIHTNSRYLVWPWFPCVVVSILLSLAYCVTWWIGEVTGYWMLLTILQILAVLINLYCLLCVIIQYMRIVRGRGDPYLYEMDYNPEWKNTVVHFENQDKRGASAAVKPARVDQFHSAQYDQHQNGEYNFGYDPADPLPPKVGIYNNYGQEMPVKTAFEDANYPSGGEDYTNRWVKTQPTDATFLANAEPLPPYAQDQAQIQTEPNTPTKLDAAPLRPSRSVPAINEEDTRKQRHRHRAHSVGSRSSRRSKKTYTSDSSDSEEPKRSRSRRRGHRSSSRDKGTDSDTGYSRSERSRRHHRRHHSSGGGGHSKRRADDDDDDERRGRRHRRPRDVKRSHRDRQERDRGGDTTTTTPDPAYWANKPPPGAVPLPQVSMPVNGGAAGRGISIPQHIVIPPTQKGAPNQPQRFQINSEITISYSDRSTNPSDTEAARRRQRRPPAPLPKAETPVVLSPDPDEEPANPNRNSYGAESSDSKGYGSTAV